MAVRALLHLPKSARRGDVIEVRALLGHPMETGYRADMNGKVLPRDIVRRVECHYGGQQVFAADLFPAIAVNPFLAFHLVADSTGPVVVNWSGDHGFVHTESAVLTVE